MQQGSSKGRIFIALIIAAISVIVYYRNTSVNPVTGAKQHIGITADQEIALGLQAAPEMEQQFGGLDPDPQDQALVQEVGQSIVSASNAGKTPYKFEYHALADDKTINAFALPGGQIF